MAKGYWIVEVDVQNLAAYRDYGAFVGPFLERNGGRFLVRGGEQEIAEGSAFSRTVVVEFDSLAEAQRLYHSAEYREGKRLRDGIAETNFVIVEGLDP